MEVEGSNSSSHKDSGQGVHTYASPVRQKALIPWWLRSDHRSGNMLCHELCSIPIYERCNSLGLENKNCAYTKEK